MKTALIIFARTATSVLCVIRYQRLANPLPMHLRRSPLVSPSLSPFRSSSFSSRDSSLADGDNSSSPISLAFCSVVSKISGGAFLVITDALELLSYYFPILPSPPCPCPLYLTLRRSHSYPSTMQTITIRTAT
ncbi:hypothetical protein B0H14DRAFT_846419 [Mycena olivaceomarginata]|nr:hypothetical protein B0H14DRAFT_846419 [Mycena olivaceomarginata]